jgi:hypothetical protein
VSLFWCSVVGLGLLISFIFGLVSDCLGLLIAWACWAWAWVAVWVLGCCLKFWVSCCLGLQGLGLLLNSSGGPVTHLSGFIISDLF